MLRFLFTIVFLFVCVTGVVYFISMEKNKKILLTTRQRIPLEVVMSFSLIELIDRLKHYYGKKGKKLLIEYADKKYIEIDTSDAYVNLFNKLSDIQDFMITKRYNPDDDFVVKDYINKIMYDIWLDYAYKSNYKKLFWREMNRLFGSGDVSKSSYNEVYRRFYKYKFLEDNKN